jgi:hypothetical protein
MIDSATGSGWEVVEDANGDEKHFCDKCFTYDHDHADSEEEETPIIINTERTKP